MPTDFFGRVMVVFQRYGMSMLQGAGVSIRIALVGTIVGCIIGFAVGIVQTIPVEAKDNPIKKAVLWVIKPSTTIRSQLPLARTASFSMSIS